ncbi:MAG TPA: hypothetical protein VK841_26915 [Polyangiaceae bacterium]|nr:hypothetical protein [Polyangiaceae bacterium]
MRHRNLRVRRWVLDGPDVHFALRPAAGLPVVAHTAFACGSSNACVVAACDLGWADCNGVASDGCEADLPAPSHCGTCATVCSGTNYVCGSAGCEAACAAGETYCGNETCAKLQTSPQHCGACGTACAGAQQGGTSACAGGACGALACPQGMTVCNGTCVAGTTTTCNSVCGIDTTRDVSNCGARGHTCTAPSGATASACVDWTCVFQCPWPFTTVCNGACVATSVDPANCGTCGHACAAGEICEDPGPASTRVRSSWRPA